MLYVTSLLLLAVPLLAAAQTATPDPGIPLDIAERRAAIITDLEYTLSLRVPADPALPLAGTNTLRFTLADASQPLVIDFATSADHVKRLDANGSSEFAFVNGHVVVPAAALRAGANAIAIDFVAGDAPLNRNPDFLYALFVPARAHLALPCFDQPSLKGRWNLTLDVPHAWQAVSNGAEMSRAPLTASADGPGAGAAAGEPRALVTFATTEPLPTYLFSFAAGDFTVEEAGRNGRRFRMFHRETDTAKVARNRDAIFDLHATALEYMERYTGMPYPFGKFEFVLIPAFQFGGMEHAGKILYNASGLLLEESATQNQQLGRASLIAHETAHMWFGNLVTMRWFNDVWMKEVFANFMAAKIVNPSFPEVNHDLRFLLAHYPAAYDVDRTPGANPIRQPLDNLNEAGSLYGAIIYQKAPIIMRHLEAVLGEESFRDGLREYLKRHAFGNATWSDLIDLLDTRTPVDLQAWSRVWVEDSGRPAITTELTMEGGRIARLAFRQFDMWNRPLVWAQELRVQLGYAGEVETLRVPFTASSVEVVEAAGAPAPLYVLPNAAGWAYGGFALDPMSLRWLSGNLPTLADPLTRGSVWVVLWDAMLERALAPARVVDLALDALGLETDEQLTQRVLGYLGAAWWRFLTPDERTARVVRVEGALREGLATAATASQKSAWFGAMRHVASSPEALAFLRRVWEQKEEIPGLTLAETDYTNLAQDLAVREVAGWSEILTTQLGRIENPDRKARFAFVMPALSADPAVRDRWFQSLSEVENRRREPWVLDGLASLHHPLRAATSAKYVRPSLDLLWEIQKTGDIFFPYRWMNATLSGHNTAEVADTVEEFLGSLPASYPRRLRNIILQTADDLFRAATILQQGRR